MNWIKGKQHHGIRGRATEGSWPVVLLLCSVFLVGTPAPFLRADGPIEIRLRDEPTTPRGIIRLGHIADVLNTTPARRRHLERMAIRPMPPRGESVIIDRAEIRRVLHLESGDLPVVEFTGAESVRLDGRRPTPTSSTASATLVGLPAARRASSDAATTVVVARRALPRGKVIGPDDVRLASLTNEQLEMQRVASWTDRLDAVVGKETNRPLRAGAAIPLDQVRPPIMIRRREAVEVMVQAGACVVRMTARALEDGRLGETIRLENPQGNGHFMARVVGTAAAELVRGTHSDRNGLAPRARSGSFPSRSARSTGGRTR